MMRIMEGSINLNILLIYDKYLLSSFLISLIVDDYNKKLNEIKKSLELNF